MIIKTILTSSVDYIENFGSLLEKEKYKQKSVVYFTADIPIEIITAAGLIPVRIPSDVKIDQKVSSASSVLQPYICSKSHQFFDFISKNGKNLKAGIFSENHCDSLQNFYDVVKMNNSLDDDFHNFRFLLPINRGGKTETKYYFKEMQRLISWFENIIGNKISYESLLSSIKMHNTKRNLLMQISAKIGTVDINKLNMLEFIKLKLLIDITPIEESIDILNVTLDEISKMKQSSKSDEKTIPTYPRILISGSMFDNYKMFEGIEVMNKVTVATDLSFISRSSDFQIALPQEDEKEIDTHTEMERLLMNLAEGYIIKKEPDSVHHSKGRRRKYLLKQIKKNLIDGVIFIHYSFCDPDAFESRNLSRYLEKNMNTPTLILVTDPQLTNLNQMITRVEAFMEKIGDI